MRRPFLSCRSPAQNRSSKVRSPRRLSFERLETRRVFATLGATNTVVLDFDGESMNDAEISEAWTFWDTSDFKNVVNGEATFPSFHSLFSTDRTQLDINGDGTTDAVDAELVIELIAEKVRQDFAPYDLNVVVGDQDDYRHIFHDDILGDALVIISGGIDNTTFRDTPAGGWAGYDEGNQRDGLALAFTGTRGSMSISRLVNSVAETISHELGHSFGLRHHSSDLAGEAGTISHSIMAIEDTDTTRDRGFYDISYNTERGGNDMPPQNAHQILSAPDVLGPSSQVWLSVLEPGLLTISGSDAAEAIVVNPVDMDTWNVQLRDTNTQVDVVSLDRNSLNPFDEALSRIAVYGKNGNDTIAVDYAVLATVFVDGGTGEDTVQVTGRGQHLDLTTILSTGLQNVEVLDIAGGGNNLLTLTSDTVSRISPITNTLTVLSDSGDTINVGNGWILAGTEVDGGNFVRVLDQQATLRLIGPHDWTNPIDALDVDASGEVSPIDVLLVINELNDPQFTTGNVPIDAASLTTFPNRFFDVSADDFVSPLDALQVINFLDDSARFEGESESGSARGNPEDAHMKTLNQRSIPRSSSEVHTPSRLAANELSDRRNGSILATWPRLCVAACSAAEHELRESITRRRLSKELSLEEFARGIDIALAE